MSRAGRENSILRKDYSTPRVLVRLLWILSIRLFISKGEMQFRDTVVSILIDSSGSMRGRCITIAAMCGDISGQTLERGSVLVETLGFTTCGWRGGQSRQEWIN